MQIPASDSKLAKDIPQTGRLILVHHGAMEVSSIHDLDHTRESWSIEAERAHVFNVRLGIMAQQHDLSFFDSMTCDLAIWKTSLSGERFGVAINCGEWVPEARGENIAAILQRDNFGLSKLKSIGASDDEVLVDQVRALLDQEMARSDLRHPSGPIFSWQHALEVADSSH